MHLIQRASRFTALMALAALVAAPSIAQSPAPVDFVLIASSAIQGEIVPCG